MTTESFANNAITTLASPVDGTTNPVTLSVSTFVGFPSSGQYRILIDSELFLVTAGQGTTNWTATRAIESTTIATHAAGASVYQILTAAVLGGFAQTAGSNTFTSPPLVVNAANGYSGNLLQLEVNSANEFLVDQAGNIAGGGASTGGAGINYPTNWNLYAGGTAIANIATTLLKANTSAQFLKDIQRSKQSIAFSSSITPDATAGEIVVVGSLTGTMTINAPTNPATGQYLTLFFTQDGTGSRTLTWNAVFKTAFQPVPTASATSCVTFFYDGTNWQQIAAMQVDGSGNVVVQGTLKSTGLLTAAAGATVTTGDATVTAGRLVFGAAAGKIVPGATSISHRNNADSADNILITDAGAVTVRSTLTGSGAIVASKDIRRSSQSISFASTITPDATAGETILVGTLTGNMTINAPTNPATGQHLTFLFTQDGTGDRIITWNAAFKTAFQPATAASAISSVTFFYDGTNWQQVTGVSVDQSGNVEVHAGSSLKLVATANTSWASLSFDGSTVRNTWPYQGEAGQFVAAGAGVRPGTETGAIQSGNIFMGSGAPNNANGNNGDFYFRTGTPGTANQRLYVKSAGAWTGIL